MSSPMFQMLSVLPAHPNVVTMYDSFTARVFEQTLPDIAQFTACLDAIHNANVDRVTQFLYSLGPGVAQLPECQAAMAQWGSSWFRAILKGNSHIFPLEPRPPQLGELPKTVFVEGAAT